MYGRCGKGRRRGSAGNLARLGIYGRERIRARASGTTKYYRLQIARAVANVEIGGGKDLLVHERNGMDGMGGWSEIMDSGIIWTRPSLSSHHNMNACVLNKNVQLAAKTNSNDLPNVDGLHSNSAADTERVVRGLGDVYFALDRQRGDGYALVAWSADRRAEKWREGLYVYTSSYGGNRVENLKAPTMDS